MRVKTKKQAVIRTIYNNYNLWEDYKDGAIETLKANDITITDSAIWEEIYNQNEYDWIAIKDDLERFLMVKVHGFCKGLADVGMVIIKLE